MTGGSDRAWTVAPIAVRAPESTALLRDYLVDVANSYRLNRLGRVSTVAELEQDWAGFGVGDLVPPNGVFLVGRYGGEPAACAGLRRADGDTVELTRVFVRPARRGTGGAKRLLAAVEEAAMGLGATRIRLDTRLDLIEARALYVSHGYVEIPPYEDREYAEIWYAKDLT
ncbi:GNAT family N-acetyltransferase [Nocardia crassostreae]|uniref:GNAT family N-acetyltransferase n=1 Tax=Nocardia crassostreae TaxID=53428 RepID=UPI000831ECF4|nr:GNAT family N-acetyltransferase [Nocardia crassostreae]